MESNSSSREAPQFPLSTDPVRQGSHPGSSSSSPTAEAKKHVRSKDLEGNFEEVNSLFGEQRSRNISPAVAQIPFTRSRSRPEELGQTSNHKPSGLIAVGPPPERQRESSGQKAISPAVAQLPFSRRRSRPEAKVGSQHSDGASHVVTGPDKQGDLDVQTSINPAVAQLPFGRRSSRPEANQNITTTAVLPEHKFRQGENDGDFVSNPAVTQLAFGRRASRADAKDGEDAIEHIQAKDSYETTPLLVKRQSYTFYRTGSIGDRMTNWLWGSNQKPGQEEEESVLPPEEQRYAPSLCNRGHGTPKKRSGKMEKIDLSCLNLDLNREKRSKSSFFADESSTNEEGKSSQDIDNATAYFLESAKKTLAQYDRNSRKEERGSTLLRPKTFPSIKTRDVDLQGFNVIASPLSRRRHSFDDGERHREISDDLSLLDPYFDTTRSLLQRLFSKLDLNADGLVSYDDFYEGLKQLGIWCEDQASFRALLKRVDSDHSDGVTFEEFESMVLRIKLADLFSPSTVRSIEGSAFRKDSVELDVHDYSPSRVRSLFHVKDFEGFTYSSLPSWATVRWVNLRGVNELALKRLAVKHRLHPLAVEDILHFGQRPKIEQHEHHLFIVLPVVQLGQGNVEDGDEDDGSFHHDEIDGGNLLAKPSRIWYGWTTTKFNNISGPDKRGAALGVSSTGSSPHNISSPQALHRHTSRYGTLAGSPKVQGGRRSGQWNDAIRRLMRLQSKAWLRSASRRSVGGHEEQLHLLGESEGVEEALTIRELKRKDQALEELEERLSMNSEGNSLSSIAPSIPAMDDLTQLKLGQVNILVVEDCTVLTILDQCPPHLWSGIVAKMNHRLSRLRTGGAVFLTYEILNQLVREAKAVVEAFQTQLEILEHEMNIERHQFQISRIHRLSGQLAKLRRILFPYLDVINQFIAASAIDTNTVFYLRDTRDDASDAVELVDTFISQCRKLTYAFYKMQEARIEKRMKIAIIVFAVFLPAQFLTGVYGMNFDIMPELRERYGYLYWWLLAMSFCFSTHYSFKAMQWL